MVGPANGVSNYLALGNIIACWFFGFARFGHLNYEDIKQLSHKDGGSRAHQDHPLATSLQSGVKTVQSDILS